MLNHYDRQVQSMLDEFVGKEVICNMTVEVDFILRVADEYPNIHPPYDSDDIDNLYYPICQECEEDLEIKIDEDGIRTYHCDYCKKDIDEGMYDDVEQEVFEWWRVSYWLCEALKKKGEVVIGPDLWGRCTTGQSIALDSVIFEIAKESGFFSHLEEEEDECLPKE